MIEKVRIQGYRRYRDLTFIPNRRMNLIAGPNESGKSTLLEAIALALTGRINGRPASEELNPYWFNADIVNAFYSACAAGETLSWPEIRIEVFLENRDDLQQLCGAINSDVPTNACPGLTLLVMPNPEYDSELEMWIREPSPLIPVEYYAVDWRSFADAILTARPRQLATAVIDSRTVRSSTGIDYHMRNILNDSLLPAERASISVAYRKVKASMTDTALKSVNDRMADGHASLHDQPITIAMDQSARTSWEGAVTPHVSDIPFSMAGQGQQAAIKISLAMSRHSDTASFVMIEEPENHMTHTSLTVLLARIQELAGEHQQLFVATHSSFVSNRLGLDGLHLLGAGAPHRLSDLAAETVSYFRKLPGYDTLRIAVASKVVLVEGPSDEIVFERLFRDRFGVSPMDKGIDVVAMRGLSLARCLELCARLEKTTAAIRDNDGSPPDELRKPLECWLAPKTRQLFISSPAQGNTLEPQLIYYNGEEALRSVLGIPPSADLLTWMRRQKTEAALRIADSATSLKPPSYLLEAAEFIHG